MGCLPPRLETKTSIFCKTQELFVPTCGGLWPQWLTAVHSGGGRGDRQHRASVTQGTSPCWHGSPLPSPDSTLTCDPQRACHFSLMHHPNISSQLRKVVKVMGQGGEQPPETQKEENPKLHRDPEGRNRRVCGGFSQWEKELEATQRPLSSFIRQGNWGCY